MPVTARRIVSRLLVCSVPAGVACGLPSVGTRGVGAPDGGPATAVPESGRDEVQVASVGVPPVAPLRTGRNPFAFAAARAAEPAAVQDAPPAPSEPPIDLPPAVPLLSLIGVAEGVRSGASRTAIISGVGEVFLVTTGDAVTSRYIVRSVTESAVELTERTTGHVLRLSLRGSR